MKKKLVSIFAFLMATCILAGCGSSDAESGGNKEVKDIEVEKYVTLGEYKGLEVTVAPINVTDSAVKSLANSLYSNYVTAENGGILDRTVAVGDTVNIDYEGKKDGVAFDGGTAQGYNLTIGSGQFIDGFEDGLVGVMPGETVDLNLTFPEVYQSEELAGQEVVFTVTVNFIMPYEFDDAIVATMGIEGVNTTEELLQYAYDYIYYNAESNYNTTVENQVITTFINNCVFEEIPQDVIAEYADIARRNIEKQAVNYGLDAETFVSYYYGMEMEEFVNYYSVESAKQDMALQAVANKENLNIDDEELNTILQEYATNAGYDTVEAFLGEESAETFRTYLVCEKALEFMVDNAVIKNE